MVLEGLQEFGIEIGEGIKTFVTEKPLATAAIGVGVLGVGALGAGIALAGAIDKDHVPRHKKRSKKGIKHDRKFKSKQKHEQKYQRKKKYKIYKKKGWVHPKKSKSGIHYTKKGQPYRIQADGRARFIKKTKGRTR